MTWARGVWPGGSGPAVARSFHCAFALVSLFAWCSLAVQVRPLIGPQGLLPLRDLLDLVADRGGASLIDFPTLLRWPAVASDGTLLAGTILGAALATSALFGFAPRVAFAASTILYLSYATAGRSFFAFQWDSLLVECGALAAFLPAHRAAPAVHLLLRIVLFKLYFESGVAKALSPIGDWTGGSAMAAYYETAPLPTAIGAWAHHLPAAWHRIESWLVLAFELGAPIAIFGPRRARLIAAAVFTGFQVLNFATANYGFFCPLAVSLHLFLLEDRDVARAIAAVRRGATRLRLPWPTPRSTAGAEARVEHPRVARARHIAAVICVATFIIASVVGALDQFAGGDVGGRRTWRDSFTSLQRVTSQLRVVNTYHLFASVTRDRVEPEIQLRVDGAWSAAHLRHKPGDPSRPPGFVAPHQPRLDFQLWFHGLRFQVSHPEYLVNLAERLCDSPNAVAGLFAAPLPARIEAVRVAYHRYQLASPDERRREDVWWRRTYLGVTPDAPCAK